MMRHYIVRASTSFTDLMKLVNDSIDEGWILQGGIAVVRDRGKLIRYHQAMSRKSCEEPTIETDYQMLGLNDDEIEVFHYLARARGFFGGLDTSFQEVNEFSFLVRMAQHMILARATLRKREDANS